MVKLQNFYSFFFLLLLLFRWLRNHVKKCSVQVLLCFFATLVAPFKAKQLIFKYIAGAVCADFAAPLLPRAAPRNFEFYRLPIGEQSFEYRRTIV
jgi:hypothetical protein